MVDGHRLVVVVERHGDHVEPGRSALQMAGGQIVLGDAGQLPLLAPVHCLQASAEPTGMPCFDLDKDDCPAATGDDIHLAEPFAVVGVEDFVATFLQMAAGHTLSQDGLTWEITLRDGLMFHDGTPVRAVDCIASLKRWGARDALGQLLMAAVSEWQAKSDKTFAIRLKQRFRIEPHAFQARL